MHGSCGVARFLMVELLAATRDFVVTWKLNATLNRLNECKKIHMPVRLARRPRAETDQRFFGIMVLQPTILLLDDVWLRCGRGQPQIFLWRFRVLNPWWVDPFTFTSIFGPMVWLRCTRREKRNVTVYDFLC